MMRRISFCFTVSMMVVMLLLTMSAAPVLANDNDRRHDDRDNHGDRNDGIFFGFHDLVDLNDDECDFDLDGICDDEEDVDIDRFTVGQVPCFAVIEEEDGDEDLQNLFCFPTAGGTPIEVI